MTGLVSLTLLSVKNFQVVLGGPYLPHIELILRNKASSMCSPVISTSDSGNRSIIKKISNVSGSPCQVSDIILDIEKDLQLVCTLIFPCTILVIDS